MVRGTVRTGLGGPRVLGRLRGVVWGQVGGGLVSRRTGRGRCTTGGGSSRYSI